MKNKKLIFATALVVACSISFQSCIGSFSLTNKVLTWNRNVNNKFVNELVFFAFWVLPVYEVTAIADLLVINSIEFWSGNKPLEANNRVISSPEGNYYIMAHELGYNVTSPDGNVIAFDFDINTQTWSFSKDGEKSVDFLRFKDNDHVEILDTNGQFVDVELSPEGLDNYKAHIYAPLMANN